MKKITLDFETYNKELVDEYYKGVTQGLEKSLSIFESLIDDELPFGWCELDQTMLERAAKLLNKDFDQIKKVNLYPADDIPF